MAVTVKVDLEPLKKFERIIQADLRRNANGPIRDALTQWAARFRGAMQERYSKFSRSGWKRLAESTKKRRRKARRGAKGARSFAVLRDTGTLFNALNPTWSRKPGAIQEKIQFGVRVGYGGPHKHPGSKASVADIAHFHQTGAGRLPVREIITSTIPTRTIAAMRTDMERGVQRAINIATR